ncbi:MAG: FAD:protein FMN transferase [Planctomycetes bacterium]|nr:FAD:protein FMN transferase [Planctomycetota bacterium]
MIEASAREGGWRSGQVASLRRRSAAGTAKPFLALLLAVAFGVSGCQTRESPRVGAPVGFVGLTMGTSYSVKVARLPTGLTQSELRDEVNRRLERLNALMSTFRDDSEVSRFNASASTDWFSVSRETAVVVSEAQRISQLTHGAFDVTVEPLVKLWHFGPDDGEFRVPTEEQIRSAQQRVGFENLEVRLNPPALRKKRSGLTIDLSAIAKGYAVDQVAEYLESAGVSGYLVEIGGETRTRGTKADGQPWRVGIEQPDATRIAVLRVIELRDGAVATSGDYRNFFVHAGKRYSHEIDPRTGRPIEFRLALVSVVHRSCMTADALATAIMVMGPDEGYNFAIDEGLAVLMVERTSAGLRVKTTPKFQQLFGPES